ncbi:MAG TPA: helix-turn-helix domain-containing protein [Candidatus Sulfotelmatobacter sp.]|nr:helix-turn-helix domain-containing protein [Candidatus Sulfotelmatobacter sp.]
MTTDELLDVEEAAAFFHVKECTVRSWVLKKQITYVKLGRRVLFRRSDLEARITESVVLAAQAAK